MPRRGPTEERGKLLGEPAHDAGWRIEQTHETFAPLAPNQEGLLLVKGSNRTFWIPRL